MTVENQSTLSAEERFDTLADMFVRMEVYSSPSELHGLLCAKLASNAKYGVDEWFRDAAVFLEQRDFSTEAEEGLLAAEHSMSLEQLRSVEFGLELILPADEEAVAARVESIGRWCVGFLAGIDRSKTGQLSQEAKESLEDLNEIANIEIPDDAQGGEEQDLMEVVEYVRLAAIMIFMELNPQQDSAEEAPHTIH